MRSSWRGLVVVAMSLGLTGLPTPVTAGSPDFVYQSGQDAPLRDGRTYQLRGTKTENGCHYEYPALTLQDGETTRIQRDVAIDQKRCIKLVEEGTPTVEAAAEPDPSVSSVTADVDGGGSSLDVEAPVTAASTVSSGYHATWYENFLGHLLTGDTTYITWVWNGTCATSGSTSGEWSWNTAYGWSLLARGGHGSLACARYTGETWGTFGLGSCRHFYYYVRAFGSATGRITGSFDEQATCGPVWFKSKVVKTT